jgi:hypothetical protein
MEFYDAMNYLVNPIQRADAERRSLVVAELRRNAAREGTTEVVERARILQALLAALNGADRLFSEYDYGYLDADAVAYVGQMMTAVFSPIWNELTSGIASRRLDEAGIYPGGWEEWGEDGRAHLKQKFAELGEFYSKAARAGACVVVGASGMGLEERLQPWRERIRIERETPTDWFQPTGGDGHGSVDGHCRYCEKEFSFDAHYHERPSPRCPACGR